MSKIAILGAGAVGSFYGAKLARFGHEVCFFMRSHKEEIRRNGLKIKSIDGDFVVENPQIPKNYDEIGEVDFVVIAWKSTSNEELKIALKSQLVGEKTRVITLQNGIGNAEAIAQVVPAQRVFAGLSFISSVKTAPGLVDHTAGGFVSLAPFLRENFLQAQEIATEWKASGISCKASQDLEQIQWKKLVWNIPFNGLCVTMGGIDVQVVLSNLVSEERVLALMNEVCAVSAARGFPIEKKFVEQQISATRAMGPYLPSSAVDFLNNRPLEIEAIWGIPLSRAKAAEVFVPEMERLFSELTKICAKKSSD